jgi:hypothetical protein
MKFTAKAIKKDIKTLPYEATVLTAIMSTITLPIFPTDRITLEDLNGIILRCRKWHLSVVKPYTNDGRYPDVLGLGSKSKDASAQEEEVKISKVGSQDLYEQTDDGDEGKVHDWSSFKFSA